MAVHLITGYKGTEHIQSKDARSFNAAMFGAGQFVMEIGNQLDGSIINNNTVRILDGDILMQGGHIRLETDTYEDLTITTGTAGMNRNDLIVMTYEKNASDGTENAYIEVIKGTETEGTATDPSYVTGTLAEGALKNQMPLYRVKIEGVVLASIEALFTTIPTYKTLAEQYATQFKNACDTYLGSLNILDTMEEIEANTQANQLAGALALKEMNTEINNSFKQTTIEPEEGVELTTIDEKLNYLIENGTGGSNFDNSVITFSEMNMSQQIDVEKNDVIVVIASCAYHSSTQDYGTLSGTCKYALLAQTGKVVTTNDRYTQHCITVIKITEAGTLIGTPFGSAASMITFVKVN